MKETLERLADQVLDLDPQQLRELLPQIQDDMEQAQDSAQWARAVVSFFLINAVRFKQGLERRRFGGPSPLAPEQPKLRLVK